MSAARFLTAVFVPAFAVALSAAPVPRDKPDDRELHVVCQGRLPRRGAADKTEVKVDRPGKEVTLVLGGNREMAWNVSVTDSTRLVKVILIGRVKQTVGELPKTAEVVEAFPDRQSPVPRPYILVGEDPSDAYFRPMIRQLHSLTGLEVASFRVSSGTPVIVDQLQADAQLRSDYPQVEPAGGLPKLEFRALTYSPDRSFVTNYAKFTLTGGPVTDGQTELPQVGGQFPQWINGLAIDPATNKGYALASSGYVFEIDVGNKTTTPLPPLPGERFNSRPVASAITLDTKRGRLLAATHTRLLTYSPTTGKWDDLRALPGAGEPGGRSIAGFAYESASDSLYLLTGARTRRTPTLQRFNADGESQSEISVSGPFLTGILGQRLPSVSNVQLLVVDKMLVLVANAVSSDLVQRKRETENFIYLIDPQTGKARLAWKHSEVFPGDPLRRPVPPPRNPAS